MKFVGIDLAWGTTANTGLCLVDGRHILDSAVAKTDEEILDWVRPHTSGDCIVAIDAPLIVRNHAGQRSCEQAISRCFWQHHASAHSSNLSRPAFSHGVRGERLALQLGLDVDPHWQAGQLVQRAIEVYPQPAIVALFGLPVTLKYKAKSGRTLDSRRGEFMALLWHLEMLSQADPPLDVRSSPRWVVLSQRVAHGASAADLDRCEDELDAYVCAYIALYYWTHGTTQCRVVGDLVSGYIVTPVTAAQAACLDAEMLSSDALTEALALGVMMQPGELPSSTLSPSLTQPEFGVQWADDAAARSAASTSARGAAPSLTPQSGVASAVRTVDRTGQGDHRTISRAIAAAMPGDRIVVRPGPYRESLVIDKPLEIIGEGELGQVVVVAVGRYSAVVFVAASGRIANLTFSGRSAGYGVHIRQGHLELEGCDLAIVGIRTCIRIHDSADPILRRNRIHGARYEGVDVGDYSRATLEDNDVFDNKGNGVLVSGDATLRKNRVHDNKREGVYVSANGRATLEDNDLHGNGRNGVWIMTGVATLRKNRVHDNKGMGVTVLNNGRATLEDNDIFFNNYGVAIIDGAVILVRNRIIHNRSYGVFAQNAVGTCADNDLRSNQEGAWLSGTGQSEGKLERSGNLE